MLSMPTLLQLMFMWITDTPVVTAAVLTGVSDVTAIQWYQYYRDVCSRTMLGLEQKLGGQGVIVQIDESLMFKRKNNIGRVVEQFWVFGMYDLSLRKGYIIHVEDRSAETLLPIIQQWVIAGTTIHSDEWRAYARLSEFGYVHQTVNHAQNFVDPVTGATTNHVEALWSRIKRRLKFNSGSQGEMRWAHLDEACYRHWFGMKAKCVWRNWDVFLSHVRNYYQ
jgi:transposase-like protein